jgi:hypothetical protein
MKKAILYSIVFLILGITLLFRLGFLSVNLSPHNTYKLDKSESGLIENATSQFKERVESGRFDEIQKEFAKTEGDESRQNWIINDLKNDRAEFGKSLSWELFRVAQPRQDKELNGKLYFIDYLTKTEKQEVYEHFIWLIKENNEIKLIFGGDMDTTPALNWRLEERDQQKILIEKHPNEIIIPFADRYVEIRY